MKPLPVEKKFIRKPGHQVWSDGKRTVLKQDGKFYTGKGVLYPEDPAEIERQGLLIPADELNALKRRKALEDCAKSRISIVPSSDDSGETLAKGTSLKDIIKKKTSPAAARAEKAMKAHA